MRIEQENHRCMNTFTQDHKYRTSNQPLPDKNKIFKYKNIKNAGKPEQIKEKDIFDTGDGSKPKKKKEFHKMRDGTIMSGKKHKANSKVLKRGKPTTSGIVKKDIFDPNESIGNHNKKTKLKSY